MKLKRTIIFYDASCPLCSRTVQFLLGADSEKVFYFAPLKGKTAQDKLSQLKLSRETLILLEEEKGKKRFSIEGRGAMRIFWLLGGKYRLIGWLSFLPRWLLDPFYRVIARNRYRMVKEFSLTPYSDRFLP